MDSNMFVIVNGTKALIIDPNTNSEAMDMLGSKGIDSLTIVLTHEHFDHISGVNALRSLVPSGDCVVIASENCSQMIPHPNKNLSRFYDIMFITKSENARKQAGEAFSFDYGCSADITFRNEYTFDWNNLTIKLKETPGHSPGSICMEIYDNNWTLLALATGDSLVQGNKIVTRLPGGDKDVYRNITMPYLASFDGNTLVLPGHGSISHMKELEIG